MENTEYKPSDFITWPWSSVKQNSECEQIAKNIMVVLKRTGDTFRPLTWEEYKSDIETRERTVPDSEKAYFDNVIDFCKSADTAQLFSESWKK